MVLRAATYQITRTWAGFFPVKSEFRNPQFFLLLPARLG
jgi:hypothetical protein